MRDRRLRWRSQACLARQPEDVEAKGQKCRAQKVANRRQVRYAHVVGIFVFAPRQMHEPIANEQEQNDLLI